VSLVKCEGKQWNPGRKDSQELFKGMRKKMCAIWTKEVYFGMLYQIVDLARRVEAVKKGRKVSNESQLHSSCLHQVRKKNQL